ncbi:MAG: glycosyltransferase family 39 protein [Leptolyngbyaceae cyanobacterium MAG.088]|nr:glycosyltransferase family 39 protein [Leptolyngbyaceae cyanobacterium MAG.088]
MLKLRLKNQQLHLPLILLLAALLRLWRLGAKPLWVDELYTAFYSLGKTLDEIPMDTLLPPEAYWSLLDGLGSPGQAAQTVTTQSNHPPLFFMAMNAWLQAAGSSVWSLRAFAVLWGVIAVAAVFYLGQRIGGRRVGTFAALLMAVSPYGIYLSQEARHYSLAIAIALFALVNWIALLQGERSPWRWLSWIGLNALGLYVHYFYGFSVIAQWLVTISRILWRRNRRSQVLPWLLAMGATGLLYLPWLPTTLTHFFSEGGTNWLSQSTPIWQTIVLPWLQSLVAAVFMLIMLPVEQVPLGVTIVSALVMLGVFGLVLNQIIKGWHREGLLDLWSPIVSYSLIVFGIMMAITYGLGKDLTLAPRYFFMVYPALTVIAAQALARRRNWVLGIAIAAGIFSQLLISYDIALLKPYLPGQVGRRLGADTQPTIVLVAPQQDRYRALTLSYVLALPPHKNIQVAFTEPANAKSWQPQLTHAIPTEKITLWLVEPKRQGPFPSIVKLPQKNCFPMGKPIKTEGTRQQQYQCRVTSS